MFMKWITIALIIAIIIVGVFIADRLLVQNVITYEMHLEVGSTSGFNLDTDKLYFGRVVPGSSASRDVIINSSYSSPLRVALEKSGPVADLVVFSENNFVLMPGEHKKVSGSVAVPLNMSYGVYTGTLRVVFRYF